MAWRSAEFNNNSFNVMRTRIYALPNAILKEYNMSIDVYLNGANERSGDDFLYKQISISLPCITIRVPFAGISLLIRLINIV
jgi:hypothetical protein